MKGWTGEAGHERRTVVRALLARPLLRRSVSHTRTVDLARKHQAELRTWFDFHLGWQLQVERDQVRLFKIPEAPGRYAAEVPTARQCALYCLVLAVLEDCGRQTVISDLAKQITALTAAHPSLRHFDATVRRERYDLVAVVRLLGKEGVLTPTREATLTAEDEKAYIDGAGNALYDVDHRTAALLLSCPVPPSRAGAPDGLLNPPEHGDGTLAERAVHHAVMRRLVDDPVMYLEDLPGPQQEYFHAHAAELLQAVRSGLDVRLEVREEGVAVIDEELSDLEFPKSSAASFAALLMADRLFRDVTGFQEREDFVSETRLLEIAGEVAALLLQMTRNINGHPVDAPRTREAALLILARLDLVSPLPGGIRVRPALARYHDPSGLGARKVDEALMLFGPDEITTDTSGDDSDDTFF